MSLLNDFKKAVQASYDVEAQLTQGADQNGVTIAFSARRKRDNQPFELHLLAPPLMVDSAFADQFRAMMKRAVSLIHPHIQPIYALKQADGFCYLITEQRQGQSLQHYLQQVGPFPMAQAVRLGRQVASVLDYAHEQGILHGDLHDGNILVADDLVTVTDYGGGSILVG